MQFITDYHVFVIGSGKGPFLNFTHFTLIAVRHEAWCKLQMTYFETQYPTNALNYLRQMFMARQPF